MTAGGPRSANSLTLDYALDVPPGGQDTITLTFQALTAGDFTGDLNVVVGVRRKIAPVRLVIDPPRAVTDAGPTALPEDIPPAVQAIPFRAVVQIIAFYEENGELMKGGRVPGRLSPLTG